MNKSIYFVIAIFALLGQKCVVTVEEMAFGCFIQNESSSDLMVLLAYGVEFDPVDSIFIRSGEVAVIDSYNAERYLRFGCDPQRLVFRFANGKGYNCYIQPDGFTNSSPLCFQNGKDPFLPDRLPDEDGPGSVTVITQEDFENAYDL